MKNLGYLEYTSNVSRMCTSFLFKFLNVFYEKTQKNVNIIMYKNVVFFTEQFDFLLTFFGNK